MENLPRGVNTAPPSPCLERVGGHHKTTSPINVSVLLLLPRPLNQQVGLSWTSDICERAGNGNENSATRKVYGRERSDGTDERGFLSNSMMINASNIVAPEKIWINPVAG